MSTPVATHHSGFYTENTWILYSIGATFALARIGIRWYVGRRLSWEEILMFAALLFWTGDTALIAVTVTNGTNQLTKQDDRSTLSDAEIKRRTVGSKAFISAWFCYTTAIWLCKLAILALYDKLMTRLAQQRAVTYAKYILAATYLACIIAICSICRPFNHNWQVFPYPGKACTDGLGYVWCVESLNILTDLMLLALPMPLLMGLQVSTTRKIMLVILFGLGIFVIIATILRIYFSVTGGSISNVTFWSEIETATLFIVSNAPGIRTIFTVVKKKVSSGGGSQSYPLGTDPTGRHGPKSSAQKGGTITQIHGGAADSQEHIIGEDMGAIELERGIHDGHEGVGPGGMVILTEVTYDVSSHPRPSSEDGGQSGRSGASGSSSGGGMMHMGRSPVEPM